MGVRHWGMLQIMMDRIHKENGFVPPPDPYDQAVIPVSPLTLDHFLHYHLPACSTTSTIAFHPSITLPRGQMKSEIRWCTAWLMV